MEEKSGIKERHARLLMESLASMRVTGKADVIIVCWGQDFYAHKLILEANSPYFRTMFQSNLEEAKSGKVVFDCMDSETLDAILDFVYLGDVEKVKTEDLLTNVLEASHMLELQDLFQYCCSSLLQILSPENFLTVWGLAAKYEAEIMLAQVKSYFLENSDQLITSNIFLNSDVNQLKDLIVFFKLNIRIIDKMLAGIIRWLQYDMPTREQFTRELFTYIDANRVSRKCVTSLLDDSELMMISKELADRLKDLAIKMFLDEGKEFTDEVENVEMLAIATKRVTICGCKLFFLKQQCVSNEFIGQKTAEEQFESYIQQFDLETMSWKPMRQLSCVSFKVDAMCQYKDCIFLASNAAGYVDVLYDMRKNTLQYVKTENNPISKGTSACCFKDHLYLIGLNETPRVRMPRDKGVYGWYKTSPTQVPRNKPALFTSEKYLYAIGGYLPVSGKVIECSDGISTCKTNSDGYGYYPMTWTVVELPKDFIKADVHFFPYNNQLCGVCNLNGVTVKLMYNNDNSSWNVQEFPQISGHGEMKVNSLSHFRTPKNPFLLVTTANGKHGIPNFALEMGSVEWIKLPETKKTDLLEVKTWANTLTTACYLP